MAQILTMTIVAEWYHTCQVNGQWIIHIACLGNAYETWSEQWKDRQTRCRVVHSVPSSPVKSRAAIFKVPGRRIHLPSGPNKWVESINSSDMALRDSL
jgi:hypothetical protein